MSQLTWITTSWFSCVVLTGCLQLASLPAFGGQPDGAIGSFAQEKAAAKRAGRPLSTKELQAPLPPLDENSALLYMDLTRRLRAEPLRQEDKVVEELPRRGLPTDAMWERLRRALGHRSDILSLTHRAAARPKCVFVRNWSTSNPLDIQFPEFEAMRKGARFLAAESLLMARDGKAIEAVRHQALGFRIARHAAADSTVIGYLVGVALDAITLQGMQRILYVAGNDPAVADAVETAVRENWMPFSLKRALRSEVPILLAVLERLRKDGLDAAFGEPLPLHPSWNMPARTDARAWNAFADANGAAMLHGLREAIEVADRPFPEASAVLRARPVRAKQRRDPNQLLVAILFPIFEEVVAKGAQNGTTAQATRAAAAVLAWRARRGELPGALESAVPPVPGAFTDLFDGKPLRYRREGSGFVIYSVGREGTFDGGSPDKSPDAWDVVFRFPAPSDSAVPGGRRLAVAC